MVANILKYRSDNLIILYHYAYSGLLGTVGVIIQNSMGLMKHVEFGPQIDGYCCGNCYKTKESVHSFIL